MTAALRSTPHATEPIHSYDATSPNPYSSSLLDEEYLRNRLYFVSVRNSGHDDLTDEGILRGSMTTGTLHFSINHHVPYSDGFSGSIIILVPLSSRGASDILKSTISISFPETVVLGPYKLPKETIIMVRKGEEDKIPKYYRDNGFKIIPFEDKKDGEVDYELRAKAVNKVISENGGLSVNLPMDTPWIFQEPRLGSVSVNKREFFRPLIKDRDVSFGVWETTVSGGEQWRMAVMSDPSIIEFSQMDEGFPLLDYHVEKVCAWLDRLGLDSSQIRREFGKKRPYIAPDSQLTPERMIGVLSQYTSGMRPDEFNSFIEDYSLKSDILKIFSPEINQRIKRILKNMYVLTFVNDFHVDENVVRKYAHVWVSSLGSG